MSFYSTRNAESVICPGRICGDATLGLSERVCIQVKKVYDACMQQEQIDDVRVCVTVIQPCYEAPVPPLEFCSCRSIGVKGTLRDVSICRLCDRENFARVKATVDIPVEIVFTDATNREFTGKTCISVRKDVILYVPCESIIPFELDNIVSAVCVTGDHVRDNIFDITICVTIILKIVAEVDLLVPAFGFCRTPPCEEFAENVCDDFFGLPIFPPQLEDCVSGGNTCGCNTNCCGSVGGVGTCNTCNNGCVQPR